MLSICALPEGRNFLNRILWKPEWREDIAATCLAFHVDHGSPTHPVRYDRNSRTLWNGKGLVSKRCSASKLKASVCTRRNYPWWKIRTRRYV